MSLLLSLQGPAQLQVTGLPTPYSDTISLSRHYSEIALVLRLFIQPTCPWLSPESVTLIGRHPIAAGGFADALGAVHDRRKVVLKSYRCYAAFDVVQVAGRYRNEIRVCCLLRHRDVDVVALVGAYSTEAHPFGLVYEFMDGLDLKQYLRNQHHVEILKLLRGIARALNGMHDLGVVHGCLNAVNILVDKDGTPHLAGLGNAQPSQGSPGKTDAAHPTKASDIYDFGVVAFEVLTGHPPFFELTETAAVYSMLKGDRPQRPVDRQISDALWHMVERCWHHIPSQRMSIGEVVRLLAAEPQHAYDF